MALLKGGLIWFLLGVGFGRLPWPFINSESYGCLRELVSIPKQAGQPRQDSQNHTHLSLYKVVNNEIVASAEAVNGTSYFHQIHQFAYDRVLDGAPTTERRIFSINSWKESSNGGLLPEDRSYLGKVYRDADSVFEYGLGESTKIANHVGVRRYAGIDSDAVWVRDTRDQVSSHFRFYLADIGETKMWGHPVEKLHKAVLNYQLAPLVIEPQAFDVYMVDGRFRFSCMMASFLHASARGATNLTDTLVLVHDCLRKAYHRADHLLQLEYSSGRLCAYRRLPNTTDEQLYALWRRHYSES